MVEAPYKLERARIQANQRPAHQRRTGEIKTPLAILFQIRLQARFLLSRCQMTPVQSLDKRFNFRMHDLMRLLQSAPQEGRSQNRVALDDFLPGCRKCLYIHMLQFQSELHHVIPACLLIQGMEQHPFLQRRKRINVLDQAIVTDKLVETVLIQFREREVGRRIAPCLLRAAMGNNRSQRLHIVIGELFNRARLVQIAAECPAHLQLVLRHHAHDIEFVKTCLILAHIGCRPVRDDLEQRRVSRLALAELSQVIEADLRLRLGSQHFGRLPIPAQIAVNTVANPFVRDRPHLFFDRLQQVTPGQIRLRFQQDRIQAREPAHRTRHVHAIHDRLATVSLYRDIQCPLVRPIRNRARQGTEQHIVDLRAISGWHFLQQRPSLVRAQLCLYLHGQTFRVLALWMINGQPACLFAVQASPILIDSALLRVRCQLLRPAFERSRLLRPCNLLPGFNLFVSGLQVFQNNAPGDAIDHEMVNHDKQPLFRSELDIGGTVQRPFFDIQACLQSVCDVPHPCFPLRLRNGRQICDQQHIFIRNLTMRCLPCSFDLLKAQAQGIMLTRKRGKSLRQRRRIEFFPHREHDRLVPMMNVADILLEKPRLNRRQRQFARHDSLFGLHFRRFFQHHCACRQLCQCLRVKQMLRR